MSSGMYNRYLFAKSIYKDYIILNAKKGKYYSFDKVVILDGNSVLVNVKDGESLEIKK